MTNELDGFGALEHESGYTHDDTYPHIARVITELNRSTGTWATRSTIVERLVSDDQCSIVISAAVERGARGWGVDRMAGNMVDFWSKGMTEGYNTYLAGFERQKISGTWAYWAREVGPAPESFDRRGWICISKSVDTVVRAGDGYVERLGDSYEWRLNLPRGEEISANDIIVIRDELNVLGFSIIERVSEETKAHWVNRCPDCSQAQVRERRTMVPRYTCANCRAVFDSPDITETHEKFRTAWYGAGWVPLEPGPSTGTAWRIGDSPLSKTPKSQHSIQMLDIAAFERFLEDVEPARLVPFRRRDPLLQGGRRLSNVKTRIGQGAFRRELLTAFGNVCAVTGPNHEAVLEAAHLYSFAARERHHRDGGLLFRRDIHKLFDIGGIAINPDTGVIDVRDDVRRYDDYGTLHGQPMRVVLGESTLGWLRIHWDEFRGA